MEFEYPEHDFWDFSLKIYSVAGVSQACINLQDRHQLDVNLLLLGTWYAASGRGQLSADNFLNVEKISSSWNQDIVCKLRMIRERLKTGLTGFLPDRTEAMRKAVLALEIECEHIEQLTISERLCQPAQPLRPVQSETFVDAVVNLLTYIKLKCASLEKIDTVELSEILAAAYLTKDKTEIQSYLKKYKF